MNVFAKIRKTIYGSKMTICAGLAAAAMLTAGAGSVKHITVFVDGQEMRLTTMQSQPEKIISEAGIAMGNYDRSRCAGRARDGRNCPGNENGASDSRAAP